jgi:hypothetical protein
MDGVTLYSGIIIFVGLIIGIASYLNYETFGDFAGRDNGAVKAGLQPPRACAPGFWCPAASVGNKTYPCPGGTYSAATNLTSSAGCTPCTAGFVCGEASIAATDQCPPGYFCPSGTGGSNSPIICPQGYFCAAGATAPLICPAGVFCPAGTTSGTI